MGIHHIKNGEVVEYTKKKVSKEIEIEEFLEKHIEILDKDIFIIGRQVPTATKTFIDLMGLDVDGNVVIIEIKKGVSERKVVSQILEYGVWAENIQYEEINRIAKEKHLKDFPDLYKKFETNFKTIPEPFNQNQRLYIVAEKIEQKIEDVCRYLRIRGMDIKCIELNFHESAGHQLAHTDVIVGNENTILELSEGLESEPKKITTWEDRVERSTTQNRKRVIGLIDKIEKKFGVKGRPHNRWYYLHKKNTSRLFAVLICGKDTGRIAFRVNSDTFDISDENIADVRGWFFSTKSERRISILPENEELILKCLAHAYDVTPIN